ncbi:hypothetical protein F3Y22_tig00110328pilonHSYRG00583 [Hibiscus syriacus]|uniref:Uncharacterized protein n=1 Tax=Hibiscus syriacus TaxID=106335 RepID=A0A6A3B1R9_HIBSY|nr:hypothetical protein F3Y22_tig00110328pilonHSYRG00583 [Hibiscus syriacus]
MIRWCIVVDGDLPQALSDRIFKSNASLEVKRQDPSKTNVDDLPPIVLVHGIFGFGKGKFGSVSYFAGAEKKDERVLMPDLGFCRNLEVFPFVFHIPHRRDTIRWQDKLYIKQAGLCSSKHIFLGILAKSRA